MPDGSEPQAFEVEQSKRKKTEKPMGRPPLYRLRYCDLVIEMGKIGKSQAQMAAEIGVAKSTITEWASQYQDFSNALALARTYAQAWWEAQAQENLSEKDFNAALWHKSVASRFREDYADPEQGQATVIVLAEDRLRRALGRSEPIDGGKLIERRHDEVSK